MKHTSFMTAIVAAAFAVTATSALAWGDHSGGQGPKMTFQELDKDGDGQITRDELAAWTDRARKAVMQRRSDPADAIAPAPTPSPNPGQ